MHVAEALRRSAERVLRMHVGVEIDLRERLERHLEALGIVEHRMVVIRNAPRSGIEVVVLVELAALVKAAEFGVLVAAAQRPRAATSALVVFEHRDLVAGAPEFVRRYEPGHSGAEHKHRCAARRAGKVDRPGVTRFARKTESGHRLKQDPRAGRLADTAQQFAPADGCMRSVLWHLLPTTIRTTAARKTSALMIPVPCEAIGSDLKVVAASFGTGPAHNAAAAPFAPWCRFYRRSELDAAVRPSSVVQVVDAEILDACNEQTAGPVSG